MFLKVSDLDVRYGRNHALDRFSFEMAENEIVAVLGANGAGKSSLLNAIQGTVKASGGTVIFDGEDISRMSATKRVRKGLVMVPEGRQIFVSLTVHENLLMGGYIRSGEDLKPEIDAIFQRFPNLAERRDMPASVLSGGEQQMLAISRALLSKPQIMMLDEPSLGLSPILVNQLFSLIDSLNKEGLTILLVEQNTRKALQYADKAYVLELGKTVAQGTPAALRSDSRLAEAYLGSA